MSEASVPLSHVAYAYGFGVYETVRTVHGRPVFLADHLRRLLASAKIIGLQHALTLEVLDAWTKMLIEKNAADTCNIKMLLIGGRTESDATLWMIPLAPLFPEKKLYTQGAAAITFTHERFLPQAKSLNMLPSYLFFSKAKEKGCYDALLLNRNRCITEGTRTNILALRGRTIISPPVSEILEGVTRDHVLKVAQAQGFQCIEEPIPLRDIQSYDGLCITSTSSKIIPLRQIDDTELAIPETMRHLMRAFEAFLASVIQTG